MSLEGRRIEVRGTVQGVGFRPWIYRLAGEEGISGRVRNDARGVTIEAFGPPEALRSFLRRIETDAPPAARVREVRAEAIGPEEGGGFEIEPSRADGARGVSIPPDLATCPECLREVFDPADRRHRYPFTNCTHCGPRFTIAGDIPYDRGATTMAAFRMCRQCETEYANPLDRRFHAQPNACPACGPRLRLVVDAEHRATPCGSCRGGIGTGGRRRRGHRMGSLRGQYRPPLPIAESNRDLMLPRRKPILRVKVGVSKGGPSMFRGGRDIFLSNALKAGHVGVWHRAAGSEEMVWDGFWDQIFIPSPAGFDGTFSTLMSIIHPDDRAGLALTISEAAETLQPYTHTFRITWPDGQLRWVRIWGQYDQNDAMEFESFGAFRDVTELLALQSRLASAEGLAAVGRLVAGVAHEVNTPLTGISSYTQMLRERIDKDDPRAALLEKIEKQTFRAAKIINNLLNFSRASGSEFEPLDVNRVLLDVVSLVEHQLESSRIKVVREMAADLPTVRGNENRLQQVFFNLILNARDAMPSGGWLTLATRADEDAVVVEIRDTGTGIKREDIKRIYDPFFTTKGIGRGTGLGLSVSYGILQEHGGAIFVDSAPGQGTTFQVALPPMSEQEAARR